MRINRFACGAVLTVSLAACSDGPSGPPAPKPGNLTLTLALPAGDDRAMMVNISGPEAIGTITAASPGYTVFGRATGTTAKVAVFGKLAAGAVVQFAVPDVNKSASYTAAVAEVAGPANELRTQLSGYLVTVAK